MSSPEISRLFVLLNQSKLAKENNALYQLIKGIIDNLQDANNSSITAPILTGGNVKSGNSGGGGNTNTLIQLLAGENIAFNDLTPGYRYINAVLPEVVVTQWSVLTNGDPISPELIFVDGDVVMVHIP